MASYGMLINTKKCIGCYTCRTACQSQNDLEPYEGFVKFTDVEHGSYPNASVEFVPHQCMHCVDAPCEAVCPTHATFTSEDGIVGVDHGRCIGCLYCVAACPYGARIVNEETGVPDKCRFCTVSALRGVPMCTCVEACPTGARVFGDLDDPDSELVKEIAATGAKPLAGDLTQSKIYYVR
ncbi:MAG: 4Fe-4S dicluster domain-containing protein [Coriobacteriia bacterium]|nr:4Fe-4S dicluster domain-containing protein [Coriobacteriia bacterium]MBS5478396.1 4Fe-4S dicluster domain-containing protein [Coriobacteriia bacterium]